MSDDESIVLKPREFSDELLLPENNSELAKFMEQPFSAIAQALTSAMAFGRKEWIPMGGRIIQAMLKGQHFQQVSREIADLREKGKIPDDFADEQKHKYAAKSWVELLTVIDEELPDADKLDALKAMFYSVNKVNATDGQRIVGYQLFQLAKTLTSGELIYLRACYDIYQTERDSLPTGSTNVNDWFSRIAKILGHNVVGLMDKADRKLVDAGLLTPRYHGDLSTVNQTNARLTDLGLEFCKNIETYHLETSRTED